MTEQTNNQEPTTVSDYLGAIHRVMESLAEEGNWKKSIGTTEMRWVNGGLNPQQTAKECADALNNIKKALDNEAQDA